MLRLLLPLFVAFAALTASTSEAEACGDIGCHAMVVLAEQPSKAQEPRQTQYRTIAPASGEEEVRAQDMAKQSPPTPAFWMQFKSYAYEKLPTHKKKRFTAVWIAMTVQTPDETRLQI